VTALEHALIDVKEGQEADFASAYDRARSILAETPGCRSVRMHRGVESPSQFLLLVEWDSVEAHLVNFRESDRFPRWRELIGPFFANAPVVEHFQPIGEGHGEAE
jgi:heme-degrading monooxygenase HmoA